MYMNIKNYDEYQNCENTYTGTISHYDALTTMEFQNQDTYIENILSVSSRRFRCSHQMGHGIRRFFPTINARRYQNAYFKKILPETDDLIKSLMISKEDIRRMKQYNMLSFV